MGKRALGHTQYIVLSTSSDKGLFALVGGKNNNKIFFLAHIGGKMDWRMGPHQSFFHSQKCDCNTSEGVGYDTDYRISSVKLNHNSIVSVIPKEGLVGSSQIS